MSSFYINCEVNHLIPLTSKSFYLFHLFFFCFILTISILQSILLLKKNFYCGFVLLILLYVLYVYDVYLHQNESFKFYQLNPFLLKFFKALNFLLWFKFIKDLLNSQWLSLFAFDFLWNCLVNFLIINFHFIMIK